MKKQPQGDDVSLPHLNLRLAVGIDLSSVEEVATYVAISLLNSLERSKDYTMVESLLDALFDNIALLGTTVGQPASRQTVSGKN